MPWLELVGLHTYDSRAVSCIRGHWKMRLTVEDAAVWGMLVPC